jgi:hypothetical protein
VQVGCRRRLGAVNIVAISGLGRLRQGASSLPAISACDFLVGICRTCFKAALKSKPTLAKRRLSFRLETL